MLIVKYYMIIISKINIFDFNSITGSKKTDTFIAKLMANEVASQKLIIKLREKGSVTQEEDIQYDKIYQICEETVKIKFDEKIKQVNNEICNLM